MFNSIFLNNPYILSQDTNIYGKYQNEGNYTFSINICMRRFEDGKSYNYSK